MRVRMASKGDRLGRGTDWTFMMLENLRQDTRRLREIKTKSWPWYLIESLLFENGYQAVVLYRLGSWFKRHGIPVMGPLVARFSLFLTGVDIAPGAEIGPGFRIAHGVGLVIGDQVKMGSGALLLHQVTVGAATTGSRDRMPVLGDNVFVGAGATIIGGVKVGSNVFIGANALITEDLPDDCKAIVEQRLDVVRRERPQSA